MTGAFREGLGLALWGSVKCTVWCRHTILYRISPGVSIHLAQETRRRRES